MGVYECQSAPYFLLPLILAQPTGPAFKTVSK